MKVHLLLIAVLFVSCFQKKTESLSQECLSFDCRSKEFVIYADPVSVSIDENSVLYVKRNKFFKPHFRVLIGDFDSLYNLPAGGELSSFDGTDSLASLVLEFETVGVKKIRGFIEEYETYTETVGDNSNIYLYTFEIEIEVMN